MLTLTYNEALAGFKELETLYPNCESVTRVQQDSGGGLQKPERERIHHIHQQGQSKAADVREERFATTLSPSVFEGTAAQKQC